MSQQCMVSDFSDMVRIHEDYNLYLKPIAKIHVDVSLPKLKKPGQSLSNWELTNKTKDLCKPLPLKTFNVSKTTMEYIRFVAEVSNHASLKAYIQMFNFKNIKLSGFAEVLKVTCEEVKKPFPTRAEWDRYFGDSKLFDESQPGMRPDTVHLNGLPCQFFSDGKTGIISTSKVEKVFSAYGKIRNIDIPTLDPYRSDVKGSSQNNFKPFSFESQLSFECYVQYEDYTGFAKFMDAFKGMKLVMMEDNDKAVAVCIKVDFDKNQHLSQFNIRRRQIEKEKIEKLQREREEEKRKEREKLEEKERQEKKRKEELKREQEERRQRREQRRKLKKQKKEAEQAQLDAANRIAMEERNLLIASRRLEAVRLVSYLCQRLQQDLEQEELSKRKKEEERIMEERKRREQEEKKMKIHREHELKSRILKRKLEEQYKNRNNKSTNSNENSSSSSKRSSNKSSRR